MYVSEQDDDSCQVHYRSYRLAVALLILPLLVLFEFAPGLFGGSLDASEIVALAIGVLLPLTGAYFLFEFASFDFSRQEGVFRWRWRNLFRNKAMEVPLGRIVQVRREGIDAGDSTGNRRSYRLVVMLDDGSIVGLTRGYSSFHEKRIDLIVDQVREFLGHFESLR